MLQEQAPEDQPLSELEREAEDPREPVHYVHNPQSRVVRNTAANRIPRHLFGEDSRHEGLSTPGWASSVPSKLRNWWPSTESKDQAHEEEYEDSSAEQIHEEEYEVQEDKHNILMGAAAHLEQVYDETFQEARQAGYEAGLDEGWGEGSDRADEEFELQHKELADTIDRFQQELVNLGQLRRKILIEAEHQGVELAMSVGERLAEGALLGDTRWVSALLREASETLSEADRVVCRLSPELARRLRMEGAMPEMDGVFEITEDLGPLDLVVESLCGRVDAGFKERFRQLSRAIMTRVEDVRQEPLAEMKDAGSVEAFEPPTLDGSVS